MEDQNAYKTLLESTKAIPWQIDWESKRFTYIGPQIETLLGWSQDSWISAQDWIDRIHPDERESTSTYCISQSIEGVDHEADYRALKADGGYVWVRDVVHVIRNNGATTTLIGFMFDISARKQAEERLKLTSKVFLHTHEGILITDASTHIIEINAAFSRITGYERDEVLGKSPNLLKSGHQDKAFYRAMWQALSEHGFWSGEVWNRKKTGEIYAEWLAISVVSDDFGHVVNYVALFSDITQLKDHQRQLEYMAYHDTLTGLPNRILLVDRLQQALAHSHFLGKTIAIAYLDLDGFKAINDNHGHQAGDHLLKIIAQAMQASIRSSDTLSRVGGDEFVALLVNLDQAADCYVLLDRLLKAASEAINSDYGVLQLSASIGVVIYPEIMGDPDALIGFADKAMYHAKATGKNRYCRFEPSMLSPSIN